MERIDTSAVAHAILGAPGWARVGITAPSSGLREGAALELARVIADVVASLPAKWPKRSRRCRFEAGGKASLCRQVQQRDELRIDRKSQTAGKGSGVLEIGGAHVKRSRERGEVFARARR